MSILDLSAFPVPVDRPYGNGFCAVEGLTIRAYAAIHLCVPDSGDEQLDAMIRARLREERAQRAMAVILDSAGNVVIEKAKRSSDPDSILTDEAELEMMRAVSVSAYRAADALDAASREGGE